MIKIAIDTGGTFTDFTAERIGEEHPDERHFVKYPTNQEDPVESIIAGLTELAAAFGFTLPDLLKETEQIVYGTTLALNALLEKKGVKTALLTTEGFRDALEIRRAQLKNQWDLRALTPPVLIPRRLRLGIAQRMDYKGEVIRELEEESVIKACEVCRRAKVKAIAVCYLFSFLNPEHERKTAEIIRRELPGVFVTLSSDVAPRIREYERTVTTVLNAYLSPLLKDYLAALKTRLTAYGWEKPIHIMMNSGGVSDIDAQSELAVKTLMSGPAGGACGNDGLSGLCAKKRTILADMGGTSFDVHVLDGEGQKLVPGGEIDGYPLSLPMVNIHSVGAGGGSIIRVDEGGRLLIGPESAGSQPGPVCYGQGGKEITITDALLLLGLFPQRQFLGGKLQLCHDKAAALMKEKVAAPLGIGTVAAADMIYRVAVEMTADALRLVTVAKGQDSRDYTLISAGGAFPLFAANVMETLNMREVLFPVTSPVFCAWGMLGAARRCDFSRSFFMEQDHFDASAIETRLQGMKAAGAAELRRLGVAPKNIAFRVTAEMRAVGQHHEIPVVWEAAYLTDPASLAAAFYRKHEALYGYAEPEKAWEIVHFQLECYEKGVKHRLFPFETERQGPGAAKVAGEPFGLSGMISVPVYHSCDLQEVLTGPALIAFNDTTMLLPKGFETAVIHDGVCSIRKSQESPRKGGKEYGQGQ
ncbi:MAG TPA: hydantoinase/oxoprolinase family protein [Clostridiales bacterium]|nr:hydantoinase/oxoprolinase family protein [Clostridiales bacterium]